MFRKLLLALAGCTLLVFSGTAAGETQLYAGGGHLLSATPGWLSWQSPSSEWFLWHGGAAMQAPDVASRVLGTDAQDRAVALEGRSGGGRLVERRLSDG